MIIKTPEQHLQEIRDKAALRGGKLISDKWVNSRTKYEFEDILGNRVFLTGTCIKSGSWVKDGLVTEPLCRQVMEHLFGEKFPTTQRVLTASILKRKRPLELDGYSDSLKIAFEYQGNRSHWDKNHLNYHELPTTKA